MQAQVHLALSYRGLPLFPLYLVDRLFLGLRLVLRLLRGVRRDRRDLHLRQTELSRQRRPRGLQTGTMQRQSGVSRPLDLVRHQMFQVVRHRRKGRSLVLRRPPHHGRRLYQEPHLAELREPLLP